MIKVTDTLMPTSPHIEPDNLKQLGRYHQKGFATPQILKDVMIWGKGLVGGNICGAPTSSGTAIHNVLQTDALLPKLLESATMLDVQSISPGARHAALVTEQGEVFCWGDGNGRRLGNKINIDINYPKFIESLNGIAVQVIAYGKYQTCALTHSGEFYTWGAGYIMNEVKNTRQWLPHKIFGLLDGINVLVVSCGEWHTALVSSSRQLFTYGDGTFGVLGHGNTQSLLQPKSVESFRGLWVKSIFCGLWHTAAISEIKLNANGGKLFTWGDGDKGKLGHGDGKIKLLPTCVMQLVDFDFGQVCSGTMLTAILTSSRKVYTVGSVIYGQLGNPQAKDKSITIVQGKLKQEFVKQISSGSYHVAVLKSGGSVYTWGKGTNGQLGVGDTEDRNTPTLVESFRDRQVESIA